MCQNSSTSKFWDNHAWMQLHLARGARTARKKWQRHRTEEYRRIFYDKRYKFRATLKKQKQQWLNNQADIMEKTPKKKVFWNTYRRLTRTNPQDITCLNTQSGTYSHPSDIANILIHSPMQRKDIRSSMGIQCEKNAQ